MSDQITNYTQLKLPFSLLPDVMEDPEHFALCLKSILDKSPPHRTCVLRVLLYSEPFEKNVAELLRRYKNHGTNNLKRAIQKRQKPLTKKDFTPRNILREFHIPKIDRDFYNYWRTREIHCVEEPWSNNVKNNKLSVALGFDKMPTKDSVKDFPEPKKDFP